MVRGDRRVGSPYTSPGVADLRARPGRVVLAHRGGGIDRGLLEGRDAPRRARPPALPPANADGMSPYSLLLAHAAYCLPTFTSPPVLVAHLYANGVAAAARAPRPAPLSASRSGPPSPLASATFGRAVGRLKLGLPCVRPHPFSKAPSDGIAREPDPRCRPACRVLIRHRRSRSTAICFRDPAPPIERITPCPGLPAGGKHILTCHRHPRFFDATPAVRGTSVQAV